jgi:hypothetical protein
VGRARLRTLGTAFAGLYIEELATAESQRPRVPRGSWYKGGLSQGIEPQPTVLCGGLLGRSLGMALPKPVCGRLRYQPPTERGFALIIWRPDGRAGGPPRTPGRADGQERPADSLGYATQPYISNKAHSDLPSVMGAFTSGVRSNKCSKGVGRWTWR